MANGKAGAPIGNKNAQNSRQGKNCLTRAIKRKSLKDYPPLSDEMSVLVEIWEGVIDLARGKNDNDELVGDGVEMSAVKEILDRLDGKAVQQIDLPQDTTISFNMNYGSKPDPLPAHD